MKFGKNLACLSIPEWKVYNLDYNDLKASIRDITAQQGAGSLTDLHHKFIENFDYINLFLVTKTGELQRKLKIYKTDFELALQSTTDDVATKYHKLVPFHYHIINDISVTVKKLTKYILVQKIALKKIFKKLTKHYPDQAKSKKFIASLSHYLHSNPRSFVNFDLSPLTSQITQLLDEIERESKSMHLSLHRKFATPHGQLKKSPSYTTVDSNCGSLPSEESSLYESLHVDYNVDQLAKFDLVSVLKKNFALCSLLPKDTTSKNELALCIDVFLNLQKLKGSTKVSVLYLTLGPDEPNPSYIVSHENQPSSVLIAHTGGLRKYSYCCLPNHVVEGLLQYMLAEDEPTQIKAENLLTEYLVSHEVTPMTKLSINALVSNNLLPSLKYVCDRSRYFLHKNASQHNDLSAHEFDSASVSPLTNGSDVYPDTSNATSTVETRDYEDSFYMLHDENIFTSQDIDHHILFDTDRMDPFPFNKFSIHSNGTNLYNFQQSLTTTITGNQLQNKYRPITLKKLPVKVQNFLLNSLVHPFKDFSIYDYMRSCYLNYIPTEQNNHYLRILDLNLLKNYESVEYVNNQNTFDESLIQDKSRVILSRQKSYTSMQNIYSPKTSGGLPKLKDTDNEVIHNVKSFQLFDPDYIDRMNDLNALDNFGDDDDENYYWYLQNSGDLDDSFLNNVILSFIRSRMKLVKSFRVLRRLSYSSREKGLLDSENGYVSKYDSLDEEPLYFNDENDFQVRFVHDYDTTLSFIYFTLCFTSLFISGINFGIIFGILKLQQEDIQLSDANNVFVFIMLVFGFIFALIFSMVSINLNLQRLQHSPATHSGIIWTGFIVVTASVMWTIVMIFT